MLMQIYADVTGCTIQTSSSSQTCALGSAVSAAVLAGAHPDFPSAQKAMTSLKEQTYSPIIENLEVYDALYAIYRQLHDAFGGVSRNVDLSQLMKDLIHLKEAALSEENPSAIEDQLAELV
jgi:L-ribulokinase